MELIRITPQALGLSKPFPSAAFPTLGTRRAQYRTLIVETHIEAITSVAPDGTSSGSSRCRPAKRSATGQRAVVGARPGPLFAEGVIRNSLVGTKGGLFLLSRLQFGDVLTEKLS